MTNTKAGFASVSYDNYVRDLELNAQKPVYLRSLSSNMGIFYGVISGENVTNVIDLRRV